MKTVTKIIKVEKRRWQKEGGYVAVYYLPDGSNGHLYGLPLSDFFPLRQDCQYFEVTVKRVSKPRGR